MNLIYHPQAMGEVVETAQRYSDIRSELGSDFLDEVDLAVERILAAPCRCRAVRDDIRCRYLKRFPYGIHYRVEEDMIRILIVKHRKRHPDYGMDR